MICNRLENVYCTLSTIYIIYSDQHGVYDRDELLDKYNPNIIKQHPNLSNIDSNEKFIHSQPRPPITSPHSNAPSDEFMTDSKIRNKRFPQNDSNNSSGKFVIDSYHIYYDLMYQS